MGTCGEGWGRNINGNNGSFIDVAIQYRLGAFGFLSSDEVNKFGVVNAGIRDQTFALQWVQAHIGFFGGDLGRVTISGESAGGGSVMLQAMAHGGELGTSLFENVSFSTQYTWLFANKPKVIAASPYLPMRYDYNAYYPGQAYYAFPHTADSLPGVAADSLGASQSNFQCLAQADTATLKNASATISASGMLGTWAFLPVTDGKFIQDVPSGQPLKKKVNGLRMLAGVRILIIQRDGDSMVANSAIE